MWQNINKMLTKMVNINQEYMCPLYYSYNFSAGLKTSQIKSWWDKILNFKFDDSKIHKVIPNCFRYVIRLSE